MSKIIDKLLSENPDTIFVFDIDGVLASYEYDDYTHSCPDYVWENLVEKGDPYQYARPFKVMQEFIKQHPHRCYTCAKSSGDMESMHKKNFILRHYNIDEEKIYFVQSAEQKLNILQEIDYRIDPEGGNQKYIVMIEDTVKTLDHIVELSDFSTVHVSSFFE